MSIVDFQSIEEKWQKKWRDEKVFEADPEPGKPKFFVTFPYSYLNGPLHIGHAFTATKVDAFARYKRMRGYNVLFPWGFHATGEPVVGMAKRIKAKDESQIDVLRDSGVPEDEIKNFEDPAHIIRFYKEKIENSVRKIGYSIDWRRSFTTIDPEYNKFIEWQYYTLRDLGYVGKGTHPVIWCPACKSPTGDHDRLEGVGVSPVEFILLKFKTKEPNTFIMAATLRPETIFGQTNLWVDPEVKYVKAKVNDETWIISKECAEKLKEQIKKVEIIGEISGKDMIGDYCTAPGIDREIIILPSKFCDSNIGSGIVTSVPSDAPYDYMALHDLQKDERECRKYGLDPRKIKAIKVIPIIETDEWGDKAAPKICKEMEIKNQNDPKLEEATHIIYKEGFHKGRMNKNCGKYAKMLVIKAKDMVKEELVNSKQADKMYETENKVVCRSGDVCIVKILEDQWFLKYSSPAWKEKAREALKRTKLYPEEIRKAFENTIEWLEDKACARKSGLGTKLPWDTEWIVETLSDSTIYMAFYTIAPKIYGKVPPEKLDRMLFDYVFLGKETESFKDIDKNTLEEIRKEFRYWYPVDYRNSGEELVPNHLTFFLFHHSVIFSEEVWPKGIGVNGMLMAEGQKMSKSLGNFIMVDEALEKHGADTVRMNLMYSAEELNEPDWREENAKSIKTWLRKLKEYSQIKPSNQEKRIDDWLTSRMQIHIKATKESYEKTKFRSALQNGFFNAMNDVKWYLKRTEPGQAYLSAIDSIVKMLAPIAPHICEEIWESWGKQAFISF